MQKVPHLILKSGWPGGRPGRTTTLPHSLFFGACWLFWGRRMRPASLRTWASSRPLVWFVGGGAQIDRRFSAGAHWGGFQWHILWFEHCVELGPMLGQSGVFFYCLIHLHTAVLFSISFMNLGCHLLCNRSLILVLPSQIWLLVHFLYLN